MGMIRRSRLASVLVALLLLLQVTQASHVHGPRYGSDAEQVSLSVEDDASSCLLCWATQASASAEAPDECGAPDAATAAAAGAPVLVQAVTPLSPWAPRGPPLS